MTNLLSEHSKELLNKDNCFDAIRYFFTISVFIVHFCYLNDIEVFWPISGATSVEVFFIISGFLIFYSHIEKKSIKYYIDKRIRRILPPYITVVILCTIAGIFMTQLSIKDYLSNNETYKYLFTNLGFLNFLQPTLPGVFEANPITAVNGSLWTMKIEVMFYISVPFIFWILKKYNKLNVMVLIFLIAITYDYCFTKLYEQTNNNFYLLIRKQFGSQLIYFYSGTFILLYFETFIKYLNFLFPIAIIICCLENYFFLGYLKPLALATIIIGFAYNLKYLNYLKKYDNISYGMYLYHFPATQVIVYYLSPHCNIYITFILSLLLTVIISLISWFFIEKPIITGYKMINK